MKSKVTKLFDYTKAEIPENLRRWRVTEEAMEEHLAVLSRSHALEKDAEEVRTGDSVVCRGESAVGRWNKPVLLFYPGSGLCEKAIEDALTGMRPGESRTIAAGEGDVTLTVARIVRRESHPVDDELVKREGVEGVETLEAYRRWYRETTEKEDRQRNLSYLARHLLQEIEKNSEYDIDEAEETAWAEVQGEQWRKSEEAQGIDPSIPEEGTDFLTEEQIREKYIKLARPHFRTRLARAAAAAALGGRDEESTYREGLAYMAERYYHMSAEELLEQHKGHEEFLRDQAFFTRAEELLKAYGEKLMEE